MIKDNHHILRNAGLENVDIAMIETVKRMITEDPHSSTRSKALKKYKELAGLESASMAEKVLESEQAYGPIIEAIGILLEYDKPKAFKYADGLRNEKSSSLVSYLTGVYAESGDPKYLNYIEKNLEKVNVYQVFNVFGKYKELLLKQDINTMMSKVTKLKEMAMIDGVMYRRYLSTNTINSIKSKILEEQKMSTEESEKEALVKNIDILNSILGEIISNEKDASLKARYSSFQ
jgi:hypothetical protein